MSEPVGPNWAGTHEYAARALLTPQTPEEVVAAIASSPRVRALGTRHSFNDIADTQGELISLVDLPPNIRIDRDSSTVSVAAGTRFAVLAGHLEKRGYALHNLGSLPHISVAGACATGTHGSGDRNGSLASAVAGLEFVDGEGRIRNVTRSDSDFEGMVIALGALGVVTRVTLDIQPSYRVRQDVYLDLPIASYLEHFEEVSAAGYSVSVFIDWTDDVAKQVWVKRRLGPFDTLPEEPDPFESDFFGAVPARGKVMSPADEGHDNTTVQGGVPGPWSERLPHFRPDATPSNGDEIQTEYFVDRGFAVSALRALSGIAPRIAPHVLVSEIRTVAGDGLWLSPTRGMDSVALHFTWRRHLDQVRALLPVVEDVLRPFDPRPHWGKWFSIPAGEIAEKYPRLADFRALARHFDPSGKFGNEYLSRTIGL